MRVFHLLGVMEPTTPRAVLLPCLLFLYFSPVTADKQKEVSPCPNGQYWSFRHWICVPCQKCGHRPVLRPCSPTHDTMCADSSSPSLLRFPCSDRWGVFVDFKRKPFRNLTKRQTAITRAKICKTMRRYRKKLFATHRPQLSNCANGTYKWSKGSNSGNSHGPRDCQPCSQCRSGTPVMFPCGGYQDTLCSFERVNNTAELVHTKCLTGEIIQIYSSQRPTVSQFRLSNIKTKLEKSFCRILPGLHRKNSKHPAGTAAQNEVKQSKTIGTQRKHSHLNPFSHKRGRYRELKPVSRSARKRCRRRNCAKTNRRNSKRRNKKNRKKGRRRGGKTRKRHRGKKDNTILDSSRCEKKYKGKRCKKERSRDRHQSSPRMPDSLGERRNDSFSSTKAAPTLDRSTLFLTSTTDVKPRTAHYSTVSSPRASSTTLFVSAIKRFQMDFNETGTRMLGIPTKVPEAEFEEDEEKDSDTSADKDNGVFILRICTLLPAIIGIMILVLFVARKQILKAKRDRSFTKTDQANKPYFVYPSFSQDADNPIPRIVDPLRRGNREHSRDSGYSTIPSDNCSRGSTSTCKEVQSTDVLRIPSICTVQQLSRNAISADAFADMEDSAFSDVGGHKSLYRSQHPVPGQGHTGGGRKTQSLSEDCSSSARDPWQRLTTSSDLWSSPQLSDLNTEVQCFADEGIENSRDSIFIQTYGQNNSQVSFPGEENSSTIDMNIWYNDLSRGRGSEADTTPLPSMGDAVSTTYCASVESECKTVPTAIHFNISPSMNNVRSMSFDDAPGFPQQIQAQSPKPRSPSGDSSVSSTSSSVSIQLRIPLKNIDTAWLQKPSEVAPENLLTTYSASVMTQTEDWTKSNLKARPIFCSSWQGFQTFTAAGGVWSLPRSDVILEVPPEAVSSESCVDVTAATYTNLAHLRQVLNLADEEVMVGPLAEFDAGPGFRFQRHVHVFLAHCLPPGVPEDQVKIHHIDKDEKGQLNIRPLPSKREYDLQQATVDDMDAERREYLSNPMTDDDIGYFEFLSSGELKISTKRFCGYVCSICSSHSPEPRLQLVVTARHLVKAIASGQQQRIKLCLHLWDRKITITDFKRDYLGSSQVEEQTLHVIDDYEDSLVKIFFIILEDEPQPQWKHALRPSTSEPIFPADKSFRLRELLCCHARDAPRFEEWLVENVQGTGDPCVDFQCIIDVANVARPDHPQWKQDEASREQLTKKVTIFIGDINNNNNNNDDNNVATVGTDFKDFKVPLQTESSGINMPDQPCHCQQRLNQQVVSNTPYGRVEQGSTGRLDLSDVPGWIPLSMPKEIRLDPISLRIRISDPTPLSELWSTEPAQDQETAQTTYGRSVSCPQELADQARLNHAMAEAATTFEGRRHCGEEPGQQQLVRMSRGMEGDWKQCGNPLEARDPIDTATRGDGKDQAMQIVHDHRPQNNPAMVTPQEGNRGTRPKILNTDALHRMPQHSGAQGGQLPDMQQSSTRIGLQSNPQQETRSRCAPSIPVHDLKSQRASPDYQQTSPDPGFLPEDRGHGPELPASNPGILPTASGPDDLQQRHDSTLPDCKPALKNQSETALADSAENINLFFV